MISSSKRAGDDNSLQEYGSAEGNRYTAYDMSDMDAGFDLDADGADFDAYDGLRPIPVEPTPPYPDEGVDGDIDGGEEEGGETTPGAAAQASPFIEVVQKKLHRNWFGTIRNPFTFCLGWSAPASFYDAGTRVAVNMQYYLTNYLIFFAFVFVLSCITNIWAILCLCSVAAVYIALEMYPITIPITNCACRCLWMEAGWTNTAAVTAPRALNATLFATSAILSAYVFGVWEMLGTSAAISLALAAAHALFHAIPESCQDEAGNILWANANKPGESVITTIKATMMQTAAQSAVDSTLGKFDAGTLSV